MIKPPKGKFNFIDVPREQWPSVRNPPVRVLISGEFLVQVYSELNDISRLSIQRKARDKKTGTWVDGISWDDLQEIKNLVGFACYCAVEVYPEKHNVVNVAAIRHLWVLPSRPDFVWSAK